MNPDLCTCMYEAKWIGLLPKQEMHWTKNKLQSVKYFALYVAGDVSTELCGLGVISHEKVASLKFHSYDSLVRLPFLVIVPVSSVHLL